MSTNERGLSRLEMLGIIVAILAVVIPAGWGVLKYFKTRTKINNHEKLAELYLSHDEFSKAKQELEDAQKLDPGSREIQIKLLETNTFDIATEYDQIKLVKDSNVLEKLNRNCDQLKIEEESKARITALCGIVRELADDPTGATQEYGKADPERYANVQNYWGYTQFKWNLGNENPNWAADSLDHLSKAISIDGKYGIAYMNRALCT